MLTHYPRDPLPMAGGTTFHFVTDGIESALAQARAAAGDRPVEIAGGASAVRQYLAAGLLDELVLHLVPVVLGAGERLLDGLFGTRLEPVEVIASPTVTHLRHRVLRLGSGAGRAAGAGRFDRGDSPMPAPLLAQVVVPRPPGGPPRRTPEVLIADKAYSSAANRALLRPSIGARWPPGSTSRL